MGHGSGVDCGGRPGWSDVHEGVVELLLSLSLRSWRPLKFGSDVSESGSAASPWGKVHLHDEMCRWCIKS